MSNFLANTFQALAKALGAVESIETVVAEDLPLVLNGEVDYAAGQAVVLGKLSVEGAAGTIVAVKTGGAASIALGLS